MSTSRLLKRRQLLTFGGVGAVGFLGGGAVTAGVINNHISSPVQNAYSTPTLLVQSTKTSLENAGPYLNPSTFNQQFLTKTADVKQIWDFATIQQVQSGGLAPIKNAMNAFKFVYKKSLYPVICLRGGAVIYACNDAMWTKYSLHSYGQQSGTNANNHPLYQRFTTDDGTLSFQDPNSFYQDTSLQALQQRGTSIAACHDALSGVASSLAAQSGLTVQAIFNDLTTHLVPGAQQTPSGSSLIAVAQHLGFTYAKP